MKLTLAQKQDREAKLGNKAMLCYRFAWSSPRRERHVESLHMWEIVSKIDS